MTSKELIALLSYLDPEGLRTVRVWDDETDEYLPVSGAETEDDAIVLCVDYGDFDTGGDNG